MEDGSAGAAWELILAAFLCDVNHAGDEGSVSSNRKGKHRDFLGVRNEQMRFSAVSTCARRLHSMLKAQSHLYELVKGM